MNPAIRQSTETKSLSESVSVIVKMNSMQNLTRSEKKIAAVITEDPERIISLSIAELAADCGVSEPTIIRLCRKLGLNGYQDLKLTLAKSIVPPLKAVNENISREDSTEGIVTKIFNGTMETLQFTRDNLSVTDLDTAVSLLEKAPRVIIIGMGNSNAISIDLQHKLLRLHFNVFAYSDPHLATISLVHASPDDVLFCISHSGSSREIVDLAKGAAAGGSKIISITGAGVTPLSKVSTVTLHTCSNETKYRILGRESRIAELAIIDSIYTILALKHESADFLDVESALKTHKY